jgi:phosphoenolpyruvate carboxykinase (ATP)
MGGRDSEIFCQKKKENLMLEWWKDYVGSKSVIHANSEIPHLITKAVVMGKGELSQSGALVVKTGKFTGRAADDKYIVRDEYSSRVIKWGGNLGEMTQAVYQELRTLTLNYLSERSELFAMERSAGADPRFSLAVRLISPSPTHALFAHHLFRGPHEKNALGEFTILHAPEMPLDHQRFGLRSSTAIVINFEQKEVIIIGTLYAGEIKKSIFSIMNTLLPDRGILPMHAGANVDDANVVSVFFGLSGTGKTTLSTDEGKFLVGDDEIGFSESGIFNMEGGCYAKTYKLKEKDEPQIYHAVNRFGSLMENVVLDEKCKKPLFDDKSITENGRASYPLTAIPGFVETGLAPVPSHVFFLSADATGVLPPVSKLNPEQAMYYFLSGYTAKLAGTELGLSGVKAAFSHCFGAPFMMRRPEDYAQLLKELMDKVGFKVWLINTGWGGGPYGVGKRFDIGITRAIIRSVQSGVMDQAEFEVEPFFELSIPKAVPGVASSFLSPSALWSDKEAYATAAKKLRGQFEENYAKLTKKQ